METQGFYKLENDNWIYAPNFVYAKDYTLDVNGNKESVDGWNWYDEEPQEYTIWKALN